jgi:hypothetical protein
MSGPDFDPTKIEPTMKDYVDRVCKATAANGRPISAASIPGGVYRDGALVAPLGFEMDEFCGIWFVQFGLAVDRRFAVHTLDLGQARFRFSGANDVQYPGAIRKNQAEVKRDELIEALDQRFGADRVNIAGTSVEEAMQICQRIWPTANDFS